MLLTYNDNMLVVFLCMIIHPCRSHERDSSGMPRGNFYQIWHERSICLKNELITMLCSNVKVDVSSENTALAIT